MGAKKINQLPILIESSNDDVVIIVQSGVTYQIAFSALTSNFVSMISGVTTISNQLVLPNVVDLNFIDDAGAETGGIPVGGIYHTEGVLKIRLPDPGGR
jgi:hypothetical protein